MDPFEVRMQFLTLLRRLNASQQSIKKAATFAVKYFPPCGEDLWDCIVEECQKGTITARLNMMYFLDSLADACLVARVSDPSNGGYLPFLARDLSKIIEMIVPPGAEGLPNLVSTKQILETWKDKVIIDPPTIDELVSSFSNRNPPPESAPAAKAATTSPSHRTHASRHSRSSGGHLSRQEIMRRIEEDRERHKRLRERRWVQPIAHNPPAIPLSTTALLSHMPLTDKGDPEFEDVGPDAEFEKDWETTSDWNEDDDEACREEYELCFPQNSEKNLVNAMDTS